MCASGGPGPAPAGGLDPWYLEYLVCPRDHGTLRCEASALRCEAGHAYPVVDGVPVMLLDDAEQTMPLALRSIGRAQGAPGDDRAPELYLESLGISDEEKSGIVSLAQRGDQAVDPVVAYLISATNGIMYSHLIGHLREYPIPELRLGAGEGRTLLDVGCNWGRWSIAAARKGYQVVGLDPSLGAVMAARRVARALGLSPRYVVGDARYMPFGPHAFDVVFSYSVVQHLSRPAAARVVGEAARVLRPWGELLLQMPNAFGIRCLYHQARRGFRETEVFDVRYWTLPGLRRLMQPVGAAGLEVDGFFGLGIQASDRHLMPPFRRFVVAASEWLRRLSRVLPPLVYLADSVYLRVRRV